MPGHKFRYGPLAKGIYLGMLSAALVVAIYYPDWFPHYLGLLLFLGLGLRPILEATGLHDFFPWLFDRFDSRLNEKKLERRRREIDRRERDKRRRYSHYRDPDLPDRW